MSKSKFIELSEEQVLNKMTLLNLPNDLKANIINTYNKLYNYEQLNSILTIGFKSILTDCLNKEFVQINSDDQLNSIKNYELDIDVQTKTTTYKLKSKNFLNLVR